jgi:hypothetical protein
MQIRPALLLLGIVFAVASSAAAVTLTDVRVGVHGDHTRIVLETDGKAPYIVDAGEKEIIVHVDAAATAEAVTAKSPHLLWAKVEPTQIGTDIRLSLKQPTDVKAMVLTGPDRIVLDLYPRRVAAAPLPAPELITEEEEPAPAVAEPAEPEVAPPPVDEPEVAAEPEPMVSEELAPAEEEMAAEPEVAAGEDEPAARDAETPEAEAGTETDVDELAGAPEPITQPSDAPLGAEPAPEAAPEAKAPAAEPEPARPTTPIATEPPSGIYGNPYLLGAVALLLLGVFVFLQRRLRSGAPPSPRRDADDDAFLPPQRAVPVGAASSSGESTFDVEADAILPLPKDEDALPALRRASVDAGDETERRIAHLERRLEELVDARERLERQVAAQTEELRVQRAAIARTQRVLRTVAPRSEDEPSSDPVKA